jgi:hypothetical protein
VAKASDELPANEGEQAPAEPPAGEGKRAMDELPANEGEQAK